MKFPSEISHCRSAQKSPCGDTRLLRLRELPANELPRRDSGFNLEITISMFLGEYTHSLDTKGRVAIPAKFRDQLTAGAIITRGLDTCLFIFPHTEWEALAGKLMALPLAQANSRAFVRLMMAGAAQVDIDGQGRVLVPEYLRNYAHLEKEAVVTGLYNRIEIWSKNSWERYKQKTESASDEIAEHLGELGI